MDIQDGQEALLDRGGHPTLRELFRGLVFSPGSGTIRLNKERLILQRANHMSRLRDQLLERYDRDEAFIVLTRLGFVAGLEDADFVRRTWPSLDPGDAFTAGTRLHMLCGCVRLKTNYNDFDFRKRRFSGEFVWTGSVESAEYCREHGRADEPMCWSQVGYASGYATRFLGKLAIYKELNCLAMGHEHCLVVGKTAELWGEEDKLVELYRREIAPSLPVSQGQGRPSPGEDEIDPVARLVLAPVRERLERIARFGVPLLVTGEPGTGKRAAARAWSEARFGADTPVDMLPGDTLDQRAIGALFDQTASSGRGRRPRRSQRCVVVTALERLAPSLQRELAHRIGEGDTRIGATTCIPLAKLFAWPEFDKTLLHRLGVASVAMPALRARKPDIPLLARAFLKRAARQHGVKEPALTGDAEEALMALALDGNLTELNALMTSALVAIERNQSIDADLIGKIVRASGARRSGIGMSEDADEAPRTREPGALGCGAETLLAVNQRLYRDALRDSKGNIAGAARRLGLTRAQLAYRIKRWDEPIGPD